MLITISNTCQQVMEGEVISSRLKVGLNTLLRQAIKVGDEGREVFGS